MDLRTTWMGLELEHPIVPGASPLSDDLDMVRRLEDAGAPCIVMSSLFEEQITGEQLGWHHHAEPLEQAFPEAISYFPRAVRMGPDQYLARLLKIRRAVGVPVVASLNGVTPARWLEYARLIEEAGAGAVELNVYYLPTDPEETGEAVERRVAEIAASVRKAVTIPIAVKLSPFYSAPANLAVRLDRIGVDGLVLFNRFYQPDIDIDLLEVVPSLRLSDSSELLLRLRWLAILWGRVSASLALSGGVQTPVDAIKGIMAGAHVVQTVSSLLRHGPEHLRSLRDGMLIWMQERGYESVTQMRGSMSLQRCPDPGAFERANYMRILRSRSR